MSALARLKLLMERQRCTCDKADVCDLRTYGGHETPHRYVPGLRNPKCRQHGSQITPWELYLRGE